MLWRTSFSFLSSLLTSLSSLSFSRSRPLFRYRTQSAPEQADTSPHRHTRTSKQPTMRAVAAASSSALPTSPASRCRVVLLPSCSLPALLDTHRPRSGASASPRGTLRRSNVNVNRSHEAETADGRSSLVAAVSTPLSSPSTSSSSFSAVPATAAAAAAGATALLFLLTLAVAPPEVSAAGAEAAATASAAVSASAAFAASSCPRVVVSALADLDPSTAASLAFLLRPLFSVAELLFIVRIVLTWYPAVDGDRLPWSVVIKPTEPFLVGTRKVVPPLAGVDVSPVVWVALLSFVSEILVGPQGILILLSRKVGGG